MEGARAREGAHTPLSAEGGGGEDVSDQVDAPEYGDGDAECVGILSKWTNYVHGWKNRWFVLHEGLLTYYDVHGKNKIRVSCLAGYGLVIGKKAGRLTEKQQKKKELQQQQRTSLKLPNAISELFEKQAEETQALGVIQIDCARVRLSKSDELKFYIDTGAVTFTMRAETPGDRRMWVAALQAARQKIRQQTTGRLNRSISFVEKGTTRSGRLLSDLRARLCELGCLAPEAADICADICFAEFQQWSKPLLKEAKAEKALRIKAEAALRQLSAEKKFLEEKLVRMEQKCQLAAPKTPDEETSDEETEFFEAKDELDSDEDENIFMPIEDEDLIQDDDDGRAVVSSTDSEAEASPREKPVAVAETINEEQTPSSPIRPRQRRSKLPCTTVGRKSVALWSLIKDAIGKDLSRICLPVFFNEPLGLLQKMHEDVEYSELLDKAAAQPTSIDRLMWIAAFAVSGYSSSIGRVAKPFNSLLGETYEADRPELGYRLIAEKVSHHPCIVACRIESATWTFEASALVKSRFTGRSVELYPVGTLRVCVLATGDIFEWSKVTTCIHNVIVGKLWVDHYGTMTIANRTTGDVASLKFKERGWGWDSTTANEVKGKLCDSTGVCRRVVTGKWSDSMSGRDASAAEGSEELLWKKTPLPPGADVMYNMTSFAMTLNEILPEEADLLPATDSRRRPDQRHLENGRYEDADREKQRLEAKQRAARKQQEGGWRPRWFEEGEIDPNTKMPRWRYKGGYWEQRDTRSFTDVPDIFGM